MKRRQYRTIRLVVDDAARVVELEDRRDAINQNESVEAEGLREGQTRPELPSQAHKNPNVGGPHFICDGIHPAFAWSEGWATGFGQYVNPDGFYNANNLAKAWAIENAHSECYVPNTGAENDEM